MCANCEFHDRRAAQQRRMAQSGDPTTRAVHEELASLHESKAAEYRATHA